MQLVVQVVMKVVVQVVMKVVMSNREWCCRAERAEAMQSAHSTQGPCSRRCGRCRRLAGRLAISSG